MFPMCEFPKCKSNLTDNLQPGTHNQELQPTTMIFFHHMHDIKLKFRSVEQMVNNHSIGLIVLTDELETRQLNIVCDEISLFMIGLRTRANDCKPDDAANNGASSYDNRFSTRYLLPEVLCSIIGYMTDIRLRVIIKNVVNGHYQAVVEDVITGTTFPVRATDGILLTLANNFIPLYADESLWRYQSVPFSKSSNGIPIPVNALTSTLLEEALQNAIDKEEYEVAQKLKEELERRKGK